ncbi:MAG: type III PLP-dependent enzyme [Succinivibrionaceae bacterium]
MNTLFNTKLNYQELVSKHGSPLLILDKATIRFQYNELKKALPTVTLHYALKPLPHPTMIETLKDLGASFDLASNGEVDLVKNANVDPTTCIHTHPIKTNNDIEYALSYGCKVFVYDNIDELHKFIDYKDQVKLLLRVSFPNPETKVDLSKKFGCLPENVLSLLKAAKELNIPLYGLSFHVGSQVPNSNRHVEAINSCIDLIYEARKLNINLKVLDIGGGFPVDYKNAQATDIYEFCRPIRQALTRLDSSVNVIAEPGRFIAAPVMTNICSIKGKSVRFGKPWYYLDDGVYCSYSGQIFDHTVYPKYTVIDSIHRYDSILAGPTCDSIDVIAENIKLPELNIGDIIVGKMMGAYTIATATNFNFIPQAKIVVIDAEENSDILEEEYKQVA